MAKAIIVTGAHYSMTSAVGALIGEARGTRVIHEPFNPQPTLGYRTIGTDRWFQYVDDADLREVATSLVAIAHGRRTRSDLVQRVRSVRSGLDALRVAKVARNNVARRLCPGRAVFKDPFMIFASRRLQANFDTSVVVCVRHPCAFADSVVRRTSGFDVRELTMQPALMRALPSADQDLLALAEDEHWPAPETAALLWRVVYRFAAEQLIGSPHTHIAQQQSFTLEPANVIRQLHTALDLECGRSSSELAEAYTTGTKSVHGRYSHVHRNAAEATERWKDRLTTRQQGRIQDIVGDVADHYGYEPWC